VTRLRALDERARLRIFGELRASLAWRFVCRSTRRMLMIVPFYATGPSAIVAARLRAAARRMTPSYRPLLAPGELLARVKEALDVGGDADAAPVPRRLQLVPA
jgi:hypothetical protein